MGCKWKSKSGGRECQGERHISEVKVGDQESQTNKQAKIAQGKV